MNDGSGPVLSNLLFFGLLLVGLYFLAIRPQRARARELAKVRAGLEPGTLVMTAGGMHGTVVELGDKTVVLELAPGVPVTFSSQAVVRILEQPAPGSPADEDAA
jgi:preprotein translocase subunit YajC